VLVTAVILLALKMARCLTPGTFDEYQAKLLPQRLADSAVVLLLVDSLLRFSPDASVAVTDASVRVRVTLQLTVSQSVRLGVEPRVVGPYFYTFVVR
jgi:hypothetical protein